MANVKKIVKQIQAVNIGTGVTDTEIYSVETDNETLLSMKVDFFFFSVGSTGGPHTSIAMINLKPDNVTIVAPSIGNVLLEDRDAYNCIANYTFGSTPSAHNAFRSIVQDVKAKRILYKDDKLYLSTVCSTSAQHAIVGIITLFILEQ